MFYTSKNCGINKIHFSGKKMSLVFCFVVASGLTFSEKRVSYLTFEVKVSILLLSLSILLQSIWFPGGEEYGFKKTETWNTVHTTSIMWTMNWAWLELSTNISGTMSLT